MGRHQHRLVSFGICITKRESVSLRGMDEQVQKLKGSAKTFWSGFKLFLKNLILFFKKKDGQIILLFALFCSFLSIVGGRYQDYIISFLFTRLSGFSFVNMGNMMEVAASPFTYIAIFLVLICATFFSLFEIGGLLHVYSMAQVGRDTNFVNMMLAGYRTCRRTLNPKNWGIIIFLIILMPLTKVFPLSGAGYKAAVPYFITQGIQSNPRFKYLSLIAYALLLFAELIYLFAIVVYVMEGTTFTAALKRSRKLGERHLMNTFLTLVLFTVLVNFSINSISSIIPVNIAELIAMFAKQSVTVKQQIIGSYVYALRQIIKSTIGPVLNTAALTVLFYTYLEEKNEFTKIDRRMFQFVEPDRKKLRFGITVVSVTLTAMTAGLLWHYRYLMEPVASLPKVCAHRGDNVHAPENTIPAYELAFSEMLPWVETDVLMTKDGIIVCSHDTSLARVTGADVVIGKTTYEELQKYEMGSWVPGQKQYGSVHVPTLDELLKLTKESGASIQIELKPQATDQNLEEEVIRLIHKYELEDRCMVISLWGDAIRRIHELDPEIKTAVCVNAAWKGYKDVPYKTNLSISDNGVNADLVKQMHDAGVQVFCWTVDSMDDVQYLVSCGVDVIGTNDPLSIMDALSVADYKGGLNRLFHIILHEIATMGQ